MKVEKEKLSKGTGRLVEDIRGGAEDWSVFEAGDKEWTSQVACRTSGMDNMGKCVGEVFKFLCIYLCVGPVIKSKGTGRLWHSVNVCVESEKTGKGIGRTKKL